MTTPPSAHFAQAVRRERERKGMTQSALARTVSQTLGISMDASAITRIEQRTRAVRLDEAVAICDALKVSLETMIAPNQYEHLSAQLRRALVELGQAEVRRAEAQDKVDTVVRTIHHLVSERSKVRQTLDPQLRASLIDELGINDAKQD